MRRTDASVAGWRRGVAIMDWLKATAADLGRGIGRGDIDPVALTEAYLQAIAGHRPEPRGSMPARPPTGPAPRHTAAAARAKAGLRRGPLDGVPI